MLFCQVDWRKIMRYADGFSSWFLNCPYNCELYVIFLFLRLLESTVSVTVCTDIITRLVSPRKYSVIFDFLLLCATSLFLKPCWVYSKHCSTYSWRARAASPRPPPTNPNINNRLFCKLKNWKILFRIWLLNS